MNDNIEKYKQIIKDYCKESYKGLYRDPKGYLKYPFIVPGDCYDKQHFPKWKKMYTVKPCGNQSCWLGPIWGVANYMVFKGLLNYGYKKETTELAEKTVFMYGRDIENCGKMHEYYSPETGEPINNIGFQSRNLLVCNMIAYLDKKETIEEF